MTKALKIGIGNLLFEFLAHTLVFLCTLNSARAVTACPLQALFNCLYCFFVGIKCYFHLLTPQFLRRLPLISSLDYTIYRNPKIVKHGECLALRSCRQSDIVKTITPEICFLLILPYAYECLALRSCRQFETVNTTTPEICFVLIFPYAYECLALHSCRQFETVNTTTPEICFVLNIALCIRVPRSLFVKGQTVFAICFMCKHKTSRGGVTLRLYF